MNNPVFTQAFHLETTPATIVFTDTTPYVAQGIALSQVKGNFLLRSVGGIFHNGTNWTTPDIVGATSLIYTNNAPLDSYGRVQNGNYEFTYTVHITAEAFSFALLSADTINNIFGVSGNCIDNVLNATGGTITITGGANAGTYTVNSSTCSYDSVHNITYIGITGTVSSSSTTGSTLGFTANTVYSTTNTLNYCFQEPDVDIQAIDDCFQSTLVVTDLTNLSANYCGNPLTPASVNGTMTINYPINPATSAPMATPIVVSINGSSTTYTVNPICTGVFQIEYNVTVVYVLPSGGTLTVVLIGKKDHEVECDSGLCCASQCIENVYRGWQKAEGKNLAEAESYKDLLMRILGAWMLYSQYYECGNINKARKYLALIIAEVKAHSCECCHETSAAPVWVTSPISVGTGITSIVIAGTGIIVTSTGTNPITYTVTLNQTVVMALVAAGVNSQTIMSHADTVTIAPLSTGQVLMYNATSGKWNNITLTMSGISDIDMTGATTNYVLTYTATGKAKFLPVTMHNVLTNDWTSAGTPASLVNTMLKSFTIPANTLQNAGDYVEIEAGFTFIPTSMFTIFSNQIQIFFGVTPTLRDTSTYTTLTNVSFVLRITMTGATTVAYEFTKINGQNPATIKTNYWGAYTESASNPLQVQFWGKNAVATANSVVQNFLRIKINHI